MQEDVRRRHAHHPLTVRAVVQETADTRSYVLDVPDDVRELFAYRPGQFCTFRVHVDGREHLRCYSMSSASETDPHLTVTVKRVPGGAVSNWLHDNVGAGDVLHATPPAGVFCVPEGGAPVVAFCGGSGVTPVLSIAKHVLASTDRPVRMLYANRDAGSVIFRRELDRLAGEHPDRLRVRHHLDSDGGYLEPPAIEEFVADVADEGVCLVCGPTPFMDLVERTLLDRGVTPDRILLERFGDQPPAPPGDSSPGDGQRPDRGSGEEAATVTFILKGERTGVDHRPGDTLLETARRGGLSAPFSCEAGNCGTCMALVHEGSVAMRANNALVPEEVEEGWVLTCQALPESRRVTVEYESF
jgi:3-ketosteroid 9alpha-monooxygenase subunit B